MANHDHSSPMSRFRITPMVGVGKDGNAVGLIRPPSSIECSFSIAVSISRPRASHSALHPAEVHCLMLSAGAGLHTLAENISRRRSLASPSVTRHGT